MGIRGMLEAMNVISARLKVGPAWVRVAALLCWFAGGGWNAQAWRFAWLSDTHVSSDTGTPAADLRAAVNDINSMTNVDFVLLSGDITELGWLREFAVARAC